MEERILADTGCSSDICYVKGTLCKCTGFIEDDRIDLGQGFQVVAALDENALAGCCANAAKESKGNGNDQGTRARDNEEDKGAHDPVCPDTAKEKRRYGSQEDSTDDDSWRVVTAEAGNEPFHGCLAGSCVFYEIDDLAGC